ncbi:chain-length determining protein [Cellvibrio mixtus]|uniref:Chain-length determining protein n=1 Tax=Cellvibrio mixtus TaxID=39650 RepID=A0A266QA64_9GAMM|nr:Wzz/FepE/Etk N-terminal domain-containing protein [Cellvibrio mixtus]OZY86251.1 chain-length determining protein [Cellvibrio mixtus]
MNLNSLIGILLARKWAILASCALALVAALAIILLTPKSYTAAIDLLVDSRGLDPISGQSQPTRMTGAYLATQSDIIRSRNVASKVIEQLALGSSPAMISAARLTGNPESDQRRMLSFLAKGLVVIPKRDSSVLSIAFKAQDPTLAAQLADAFAEAYIYTNLELRIEPAKQTSQWYNQQLAALRQELIDKQNALSSYQEEHGILASSDRLDLESSKLADLSSMLMAAQNERLNSQSRSDQIANTKRGQLETRALDNPQMQKLATDLAQAQARLTELATQVGENHPQYRQALSEVGALKQQMNRMLELISGSLQSSVELFQARADQLKAELAQQKELVLQLSRNRNELTLLKQEVDNTQAAYDAALARSVQTRLESQIAATDIAVLNSALVPTQPTSPNPLLITLLATLAGLLFGIAMALCWEWLDQRIRSVTDLEQGLGLPVLAYVPR